MPACRIRRDVLGPSRPPMRCFDIAIKEWPSVFGAKIEAVDPAIELKDVLIETWQANAAGDMLEVGGLFGRRSGA